MNVYFAGLATESNSFSSIPTAEAAFAIGQRRGEAVFADRGMYGALAVGLRELVAAEGGAVSPGLFAFAQPGAPTVQAVYERLRDILLDDLRAAMPVDVVMLFLHGAMISQACWDCEGEVLAMVREIVGPKTPIGVALDPHAHLTEAMLANATVLCFMQEYPHTDGMARLDDAWRVCLGVLRGEVTPVHAVHDCKMVSFWPTQSQPMRGFVDRLLARRGRDGILSDFIRTRISLGRHASDRCEDAGLRRSRPREGRRARCLARPGDLGLAAGDSDPRPAARRRARSHGGGQPGTAGGRRHRRQRRRRRPCRLHLCRRAPSSSAA